MAALPAHPALLRLSTDPWLKYTPLTELERLLALPAVGDAADGSALLRYEEPVSGSFALIRANPPCAAVMLLKSVAAQAAIMDSSQASVFTVTRRGNELSAEELADIAALPGSEWRTKYAARILATFPLEDSADPAAPERVTPPEHAAGAARPAPIAAPAPSHKAAAAPAPAVSIPPASKVYGLKLDTSTATVDPSRAWQPEIDAQCSVPEVHILQIRTGTVTDRKRWVAEDTGLVYGGPEDGRAHNAYLIAYDRAVSARIVGRITQEINGMLASDIPAGSYVIFPELATMLAWAGESEFGDGLREHMREFTNKTNAELAARAQQLADSKGVTVFLGHPVPAGQPSASPFAPMKFRNRISVFTPSKPVQVYDKMAGWWGNAEQVAKDPIGELGSMLPGGNVGIITDAQGDRALLVNCMDSTVWARKRRSELVDLLAEYTPANGADLGTALQENLRFRAGVNASLPEGVTLQTATLAELQSAAATWRTRMAEHRESILRLYDTLNDPDFYTKNGIRNVVWSAMHYPNTRDMQTTWESVRRRLPAGTSLHLFMANNPRAGDKANFVGGYYRLQPQTPLQPLCAPNKQPDHLIIRRAARAAAAA